MKFSKSASVSKSSNGSNFSKTSISSSTSTSKFGSKTISTIHKESYNDGELVGTSNSIKKNVSVNADYGIISSVFGLLFTLLLLINMFGLLSGTAEYRGLEWLLDILSNAPSIPTEWLTTWGAWSIDSSTWGIFEPLGAFINNFSGILNVIAFLGTGLLNILLFVMYFISRFLYFGI